MNTIFGKPSRYAIINSVKLSEERVIMDSILWFVASPFICVGWVLIGAIAGAFARRIMGAQDKPFIQDLILGIAGAVTGGVLLGIVNVGTPNGGIPLIVFNLVLATATASILIWIGRTLGGGRKTRKKSKKR
jgi:uncharacterized membrane protein YeaQ/YmgE (transglycosylase-associated protein family)